MRYIDSWLTGLGLEYIIPKLKANGITTPKKLAQLTLRDMYDVVGVEDAEDRKKLYFLIQRLHTILNNKAEGAKDRENKDDEEENEASEPAVKSTASEAEPTRSAASARPSPTTAKANASANTNSYNNNNNVAAEESSNKELASEDLRVLRKNRRQSSTPAVASSASTQAAAPAAVVVSSAPRSSAAAVRAAPPVVRGNDHDNEDDSSFPPPPASTPPVAAPTTKRIANTRSNLAVPSSRATKVPVPVVVEIESSSNNNNMKYDDYDDDGIAVARVAANRGEDNSSGSAVAPVAKALKILTVKATGKVVPINATPSSLQLPVSVVAGGVETNVPVSSTSASSIGGSITTAPAVTNKAAMPNAKVKSMRTVAADNNLSSNNINSDYNSQQQHQQQRQQVELQVAIAAPITVPLSREEQQLVDARARQERRAELERQDVYEQQQRELEAARAATEQRLAAEQQERQALLSMQREQQKQREQLPPRHLQTPQQLLWQEGDAPVKDMAIRVIVRKRPISQKELNQGDRDVMDARQGGTVQVHQPVTKVDLTKCIETQSFYFDDAFDAFETNEQMYDRTIKHLVSFVFDGGKGSCFAYGQTGSGKTFSMMGSNPSAPAEATINAGLYVLAARDIFSLLKTPQLCHLKVFVSCFEIYAGKLYDLLNERASIRCLEDAKQQVQLPGLAERSVRSTEELLDYMAQAHLQRSTGSTGANAESSRSHQIMQIVLRDPTKKRPDPSQKYPGGKLSFIDLAGSERGADTTHNNKQTRMEGAEINTSLLALKEVIRSLARKTANNHTPFRGSKLTQVLKDSFVGEKTRTCMVACVSPSHSNCEHTLNTLRYADRVKERDSSAAHVGSSQYDSMSYGGPGGGEAAHKVVAQQRPQTAGSELPVPPPPPPPQPVLLAVPRAAPASQQQQPQQQSRPATAASVNSGRAQTPPRRAQTPPRSAPVPPQLTGAGAATTALAAARPATAGAPYQSPSQRDRAQKKEALLAAQKSPMGVALLEKERQTRLAASALQQQRESAAVAQAKPVHHFDEILAPTKGGSGKLKTPPVLGVAPQPLRLPEVVDAHSRSNNDSDEEDDEEEEEEEEDEEEDEDDDLLDDEDILESTELIQKTVGLLSAHKLSIAEMVEIMKEEMELVQDMENVDDRDSELYIEKLDELLRGKFEAIGQLRAELSEFQNFRERYAHD